MEYTIDKGARRLARRALDENKQLRKLVDRISKELIDFQLRQIHHKAGTAAYITARGLTLNELIDNKFRDRGDCA